MQGLTAEESALMDTRFTFAEISTRTVKKGPDAARQDHRHFFMEPSTRTPLGRSQIARETAVGDTLNFSPSSSSVVKGESPPGQPRPQSRGDGARQIVIRQRPERRTSWRAICRSNIIKRRGRLAQHPTQALLDAFRTIRGRKGRLKGLRVAIIRRPDAQPRPAQQHLPVDDEGADVRGTAPRRSRRSSCSVLGVDRHLPDRGSGRRGPKVS